MEENSKTEPESFTLEERWVIAAAHDLAALDTAMTQAIADGRVSAEHCAVVGRLRIKAERILEQTVAALLASEREAP